MFAQSFGQIVVILQPDLVTNATEHASEMELCIILAILETLNVRI